MSGQGRGELQNFNIGGYKIFPDLLQNLLCPLGHTCVGNSDQMVGTDIFCLNLL